MPDKDKERQKAEYAAILAVFTEFLHTMGGNPDREEVITGLAELRAKFAIGHAFDGFGISWEDALELLKKTTGLTDDERSKRDIIVAAVTNLIDFAVVEQYHLEEDAWSIFDPDNIDDWEAAAIEICKKYDSQYADVEDMDIEYAMMMAAAIMGISSESWILYETQRDDRVRPWHAIYDGYMAPKSVFPEWLYPPIEWGCRCFITELSPDEVGQGLSDAAPQLKDVQAKAFTVPSMPEWFDRTFEECVAMGGRIFSEHHPYFTVESDDNAMLQNIVLKIKSQYLDA